MVGGKIHAGVLRGLKVFVHWSNLRLHPEELLGLQAVHCPVRTVALVPVVARCALGQMRKGIGVSILGRLRQMVCIFVVSPRPCVLGCVYFCLCLSPSQFKTHPFVLLLLLLSGGTQQVFAEWDGVDALASTERLKAFLGLQISNT